MRSLIPRGWHLPRRPVPPLRGLHGLPPPPRHPEVVLRDQGRGAGVPHQEKDEGEARVLDARPSSRPFQDLLSLKVDDETYLKLEPKEKKERIFEALRDLFIRESQERPLILVIEDLHWIDKTSEEFLDYLIGWLTTPASSSSSSTGPSIPTAGEQVLLHQHPGRPALLNYERRTRPVDPLEGGEVVPELRDLILSQGCRQPPLHGGAHPYPPGERHDREEGRSYVLNRKPSDIQIPDTIQGIIAARMDRLEENLKRIMQVASVIGREFAFRILQSITEMREGLKSHLLNLQGLELIYEKSLFPELEYVFKHALIQEVAYNSLLLKRRQEIHEKIGHAIEELYPDRLEEFYEMLAYHYARGEDLEKASQYLTFSGNKAVRRNSALGGLQLL